MDRFNMSMRKYLKEGGVTSQQANRASGARRAARGEGKVEGQDGSDRRRDWLNHVVEGKIDLSDAH